MKIKFYIFCLLTLFISSVVKAEEPVVFESTSDDQVEIAVTIYNDNLALIKDTRKIKFPEEGKGELMFKDIASSIIPVTVHAKSLNFPESFTVLEQNYEYDLINAEKLLDKYVGKKIKIIDWNKFQDRKDVIEATLLSNNRGQIYKINNDIYLGHPGYKILPGIPKNLIAKPTLVWLYKNRKKEAHKLEVSYLTKDISWKADYILVLDKDDVSTDISGWVTLNNNSGATYENAGLKLVAGKIHQIREKEPRFEYKMKRVEATFASMSQFKERAFFEYHIYDMQRKTTIKDKQIKQINLLNVAHVQTQKELLTYGKKNYFIRRYREQNLKQPVYVYIKFKNSKNNNLGMPLPAGIMRLYKKDHDGSLQFIGEDKIKHTPKDEEIELKVGEAFDVVVERVQTDYRKISAQLHESEWKITLRNHKEKDVTVSIEEELYGNWNVITTSHAYKKVSAFKIRFDVKVPRNKEVKVKYRIKVGL